MSKQTAIRAGRAFVELFADDSRLVRGLKAASKKLRDWGQSVSAMGRKLLSGGAAIAGSLLAAAKTFAQIGTDLGNMAARTGLSVEALSELGYAAEHTGANLEQLEAAVRTMQRTIADARNGNQEAAETLQRLGVAMADVRGKTTEEQFLKIAAGLAKIADPGKRAAMAMKIFGDAGTKLLPMLGDLEALRRRARELGLVVSKEDADVAHAVGDAFKDLYASVRSLVFTIGSALGATIMGAIAEMLGWIKAATDWIKANKEVVVQIFKIALGVTALGAALAIIGPLLGGLATIFTAVASAAGVVATVLGALFTTIPGLIVVALAALGTLAGAIAGFWAGLDTVKAKIRSLWDTAVQAFKDIAATVGAAWNAILAGDFAAAWEAIKTGLIAAFRVAVAGVMEMWHGLKNWIVNSFWDAWAGFRLAANDAIAWLLTKWVDVKEALQIGLLTALELFMQKLAGALAGMIEGMKNAVVSMREGMPTWAGGLSPQEAAAQRRQNQIDRKSAEHKAGQGMADAKKRVRDDADRERRDVERKNDQRKREILNQRDKEKRDRNENTEDALRPYRDERDAAIADWQRALDEANRQRGKRFGPWGGRDERFPPVGDVADVQRPSVAGTFSAAAVRGMGGGSVLERVARGVEDVKQEIQELRKIDENLLREVKLNKLEFVA